MYRIHGRKIFICFSFITFDKKQNIKQYGYDNVRGGKYTNSRTLKRRRK